MTNADVAAFLRELADILEAQGESVFKVRAYTEAARLFQNLEGDVVTLVKEGKLRSLPGVGEAIATKVAELVTTGQSSYLARYRSQLPPGLEELMRVPGITPAVAGRIYRALGAQSLEDIKRAARQHRISHLPRVPASIEDSILAHFVE